MGKKLFRINSRIRDIDIILEKLKVEELISQHKRELIEKSLRQEQQNKVKEAKGAALDLENNIVSSIYDQSKLKRKFKNKSRKRIRKIVKRLKNRIESKVSIVIRDKSNLSELHEVRKDTKKLRYLIELISNTKKNREIKNGDVNLNARKNTALYENNYLILKYLEKIQEMLGDIHDYDITIDYLRSNQISSGLALTSVLTEIEEKRNLKFDQFVNYIRSMRIGTNDTS